MNAKWLSALTLFVVFCGASVHLEADAKRGEDYCIEALDVLHEYHYRGKELNDAELFDGGLDGMRALFAEHGVLWEVTGIHASNTSRTARMQFVAKMEAAIIRAREVGISKEAIAIAAAKGLARAVRSSHSVFLSRTEADAWMKYKNGLTESWVALHHVVRNGKRIGVMRLRAFTMNDATIVATMRAEIGKENPDGIVIDIRENTGGSGIIVGELMSIFLEEGKRILMGICPSRKECAIVETTVAARGGALPSKIPLRILVGPGTHCAAEIFAYAMQQYGRARLIGMPTAGTVEGRGDIDLASGPLLCVGITRIEVLGGITLEGRGVRPDLFVPVRAEGARQGYDAQLEAALDELAR